MKQIYTVGVNILESVVKALFYEDNSTFEHSMRVYKICRNIVHRLEEGEIEPQFGQLYTAAYLHDIGKKDITGDAHPFASVVLMHKLFDCDSEKDNRKFAHQIGSIIVSHKGYFCPHSSIAIEAAILRIADKIDRYYTRSPEKAKESYIKHLKIVKDYFATKDFEK